MTVRALLAAFATLGAVITSSHAQSVTTAPVGAVSTTLTAGSERRLGVTLARPALYSSAVSAVTTNSVTVGSAIPSLSDGAKYVIFTSGTASGQWLQVSSISGSSLTLSGNPVSLGVVNGDKFEVRQFWTLNSLLPQGGGLPVTADPSSPSSLLLAYNPDATGTNIAASTTFFYYDDPGSNDQDGWYNFGTSEPAGDVVVSPETFFTLRNLSAASASIVYVGDVPTTPIANLVLARSAGAQDNLVFNPYPSSITVANAGLVSSGAVRPTIDPSNPVDLVLVFSSSSTALNGPASTTLFYYDDPASNELDGWYDFGTSEPANNFAISHGGAFLIRKSGGANQSSDWKPALPYTL